MRGRGDLSQITEPPVQSAFYAETGRGRAGRLGGQSGAWVRFPGRMADGTHQEGAKQGGLTFTLLAQGDVAAFFVADLGAVVRKHFCFLKCLPRVRPFYTVKCNSSPGVLKVLAELGLGFSCANKVSPYPPPPNPTAY